jgi:hypothetical protein
VPTPRVKEIQKSEGGSWTVMQLMFGCGDPDKPVGSAEAVSRWYA